MKLIPLTKGLFAQVDDEDFEYLSKWKWHAASKGRNSGFYAARRARVHEYLVGTVKPNIWMHRVLMNPVIGLEVDHRNNDGLNNQRFNLRICTHPQNTMNIPVYRTSTVGFKGATFRKRSNRWESYIKLDGVPSYLGSFESPELAAKAYDKAAIEYFGEFANLNFPVPM